ncbi:MAG: glycerol kinase GlpK [Robiginitomaculum sp.]
MTKPVTKPAILALDQGTTSSRAIVFDGHMNPIASAQSEFAQIYPDDGWVEHDPEAIWQTSLDTARAALKAAEDKGYAVTAIGITNQRETSIIWERKTGKPIYNAIVWQDRRTADICAQLKQRVNEGDINEKTGLLLDPYFSATKIAWILDHVPGAREKANSGGLAFGTVDSFLIARLTGGGRHVTDATNASRTNLYNIMTGEWDDELLEIFNVPAAILPKVLDCSADFGTTTPDIFGRPIPIFGVAGDQQAAAIGQACFDAGDIKSTYGTGCFVMLSTGTARLRSKNRLLSTIAYQIDGAPSYALEGSIFIAGAAMQWLRDGIGVIDDAGQSGAIAGAQESNNGVYMVPAFTGLGAPHWQPDARGAIFGITRDTTRADFVRAALESVCYQTHDLFTAMAQDGVTPKSLKVDGGMTSNDWLCGFLSDVLNIPVERPEIVETTALGAAYLAGLKTGLYPDMQSFKKNWRAHSRFAPNMDENIRAQNLEDWNAAIGRVTAG